MRHIRFLGVSFALAKTCITPKDHFFNVRGHFWPKQNIVDPFGALRNTHVVGVYAFKHSRPLSLRNKNTVALDYQVISYTKLVAKVPKLLQ